MATSIRDKAKHRIIEEMIRSVRPPSGWKVLIVDHDSTRIISACCRMFDIMEEGVSLVENIDIKRQPLANMDAIYFLAPTTKSIDSLLKDFEDERYPQYGRAHLYFTSRISDDDLKRIKASPSLIAHVKGLKELNLDFLAFEQQVFHFDLPHSLSALFSPDASFHRGEELKRIANKLASVCATLEEYPLIRYQASKDKEASGSLTRTIASLVQEKLDVLMSKNPEYAQHCESHDRATLLILDRSIDPIAPILHEFTYQAMVYDLLDIQNDHYRYEATTNEGQTRGKEVIIGETDPLWPTLRHMHMAETMNWILDNFNDFIKENKASKLTSNKEGKVSSLKEVGEAMKHMPQFQEMLNKYSLHINMASTVMDRFNENHLEKVASLEQDMATGEDANGKATRSVMSVIPALLTDPAVNQLDKVRLLMLYIISQDGIKDSDRKRLVDLTKMSFDDQNCILNLRYLGVTLLKGTRGSSKTSDKKKKKQRNDAPSFQLSRYEPVLKNIGESALDNTLSSTEFPAVRGENAASDARSAAKSMRKPGAQPKWAAEKTKKNQQTMTGPRLIIFIAGGVTLSETRAAYELTKKLNREVIIGGTSVITPKSFVEELKLVKTLDKVPSSPQLRRPNAV
eukprot:TRINITY_DN1176_c0_g1_i1.p1 TRINITY_DN1176_c0_g1~~TRINITY_DN1176_c0_g1_i1.p1  ORF type:complete len:627 (+),score=182.39 TRINITY_DN1176_c0_g1_i1:2117-3997(+)